jgi:hypothetical protein
MNMSNSKATAVISPSPGERGEVSAENRSRAALVHPQVIPAERQREPESITTDNAEEFLTHRDYGFRVRASRAPE